MAWGHTSIQVCRYTGWLAGWLAHPLIDDDKSFLVDFLSFTLLESLFVYNLEA